MWLKHIKIIFLPENTTSIIQPCDQGIIKTLKSYYRKQMRKRIIDNIENTNGQQQLSANDKTMRNCFIHGGFKRSNKDEEGGRRKKKMKKYTLILKILILIIF
jgi:hypothetical protein